jgi:hypothetical protein
MPTVSQQLLQVTSKVARAKKHVNDLQAEVTQFLNTQPYKVSTKRDRQTRKLIYYVASVEPTPDNLPLIAGDAIQNLLSALDHLAYQIVCCDTGQNPPPNPGQIYFPIGGISAKEYEAVKVRKIKGARKETLDAIDAIKPYRGGNDLLWSLHGLNNIDKHRLLITVGSRYRSFNFGAYMSKDMNDNIAADPNNPFHGKIFPTLDLYLMPKDVLFPLQVGDVLFTTLPDDEPNEKMQFKFDAHLTYCL